MSCCGQKRSEQKRRSASGSASAPARGAQTVPQSRARPGEPRSSNTALLDYLTRNGKLFAPR